MQGIKHLVECHCVLPQYKDRSPQVYHKFVVFSVIDDNDVVIPKHAQCNNCGTVHRVFDIMKSEPVLGNDETHSVMTIDDIKYSIPSNLHDVLKSYEADLHMWEEAAFICENELWESTMILSTEKQHDGFSGKILRFTGPRTFRIEPYTHRNIF